MGESSAKHLRGDSMADVIFNGSSARKPVAQASVELVFDNTDGGLGGEYARYSEISIKRAVTRDGTSNYYLNGTKCRRRDITDIFLGTGLGPRSYAIIEQGMISRLIEAKPEELRVYIEEAAGISKYKERRRETENRIRHTRENMERLDDLREEVEKQLNHLQRQARTAEKFKEFKQEERRKKAELLVLKLTALENEGRQGAEELQSSETRVEEVMAQLRALEVSIEKDRESHVEANEGFNDVQGRFYKIGSDISRTEQSIQHNRELRQRQEADLAQVSRSLQEASSHSDNDTRRLEELDASIAELEPQHKRLQEQRDTAVGTLQTAEQSMSEWQARWEDFNRRVAEPSQQAQVERAKMEAHERQVLHINQRMERLSEERNRLQSSDSDSELERIGKEAAGAEASAAEFQLQLDQTLARVQEQRELNRGYNQELDRMRSSAQTSRGRLASLEALQQAALGESEQGVTRWLDGAGLADAPRLAQQMNVEAGWENAVETVLGQYLEAVCVDGLDDPARALGRLEQGSITMLDLNAGGPQASGPEFLAARVEAPGSLASLLSGVRVADDLNQALGMRSSLADGESVITRDGIWLGSNWLRVQKDQDARSGVLAREQEIAALKEELAHIESNIERLQGEQERGRETLKEAESAREQQQAEVNRAHRSLAELNGQINTRRARLEQLQIRRKRIDEEQEELQNQRQQEEQALEEATNRRNVAVSSMETLAEERDRLSAQREDLRFQLDEARQTANQQRDAAHQTALRMETMRTSRDSIKQNLERMQRQIGELTERRGNLEENLKDGDAPQSELAEALERQVAQRVMVEKELTEARAHLQTIEAAMREHDQARMTTERQVEEARNKLERLRIAAQEIKVRRQTFEEQLAETEFSIELLNNEMPEEATIAAWEKQLEDLGARIHRLGPINLAAIEEFQEQGQRKEYLDSQFADLNEALETLENAIRKIDKETRSRFKATFEQVNARIQEMFPRLFGGGQAHLEMTGDDLLTTGVAIMARPPGKRLSTIHLMSGGEKALTAVAMVFAIFELNPAPFCMLDEVDAPLDEANVGRFCDLVREMSERVQFIFITHNKTTMELSEQLLGVTMREPGVSRLVTVDVDAAAAMATG
jgi:chromosome segregation protein